MNKLIKDALIAFKVATEKEVANIDKKIFSSPCDDFFRVQDEFKSLLESGEDRSTPQFIAKVNKLHARDKAARKSMLANKGFDKQNTLIERKVELQVAIQEVERMLWTDNFKNKLRNG